MVTNALESLIPVSRVRHEDIMRMLKDITFDAIRVRESLDNLSHDFRDLDNADVVMDRIHGCKAYLDKIVNTCVFSAEAIVIDNGED